MIEEPLNRQIKNFICVNEYLQGGNWKKRAREELETYNIHLKENSIDNIRKSISEHSRSAHFPTVMGQRIAGRTGKDEMYAALWRLCEIKLSNIFYVGLPATHIEIIAARIGRSHTVACERDPIVIDWLRDFYQRIYTNEIHPEIIQGDIFDYLLTTDRKFNLYDFDLMMGIRSGDIFPVIAHVVNRTSLPECVVNLASVIGRKNSYITYNSLLPDMLREEFQKVGFNHIEIYRGCYRDRIHPVKYEHFYLRRKECD